MFVKNSSQWCVVVTKKWSTTSSARSWAPLTPLPPRCWRAVVVAAGALDVPAAGDRDHHLLFGDEVFDGHVAVEARHDVRAALIAVLRHDLGEFVGDDRALALGAREDVAEVGDLGLERLGLVDDLLALERGEAAQLHREDRVGLQLVDVEEALESIAGIVDRRRARG